MAMTIILQNFTKYQRLICNYNRLHLYYVVPDAMTWSTCDSRDVDIRAVCQNCNAIIPCIHQISSKTLKLILFKKKITRKKKESTKYTSSDFGSGYSHLLATLHDNSIGVRAITRSHDCNPMNS